MSVVFVTGSTGYMARMLIPELLRRGHQVKALARSGSESKIPEGAVPVLGDALRAESFANQIAPATTLVHLVGVAHPSPWKADQFRAIDLQSAKAAVIAAQQASAGHFVYVSVAHPAPAMKSYIAVRTECEQIIQSSGLSASILRPWCVLGPGHRWPYALLPIYSLLERFPSTRESARR
jgi:uncharacterized protein YbjT (DUF2867 family)